MNLKKVLQNEIDTAFLYHEIVKLSDNLEIQDLYGAMAAIKNRHVEILYAKITSVNPKFKLKGPSRSARLIAKLVRKFGAFVILRNLSDSEKVYQKRIEN